MGTLVLTNRKEKFQILHATLLLIGGVRRDKPQYCRLAISSFPLHSFYTDTLAFTLGLDLSNTSLNDVVLENNQVDTIAVSLGLSAAIVETLLIYTIPDEAVSINFGTISASFIDSIKTYEAQFDTISIGIGMSLGSTELIDNVIQIPIEDTVSIGFGSLVCSFEDI